MTQAKGFKGKALIGFEDAFGVINAAGSRKPYLVPFNNFEPSASQALEDDPLIRGTRNPTAPVRGNIDESGSATVPVDAHAIGLWLKALFGAPTTTALGAVNLDDDNAVDLGSGKVGLPATAHGLEPSAPVVISGTTNYDGYHVLAPETSANQLVISATYVSELLASSNTATPSRRATLDAAPVTDLGGGLVGLPCAGHGLPVGAEITVAGTANYDATYTVKRGTTASVIAVTAAYAAETLNGDETADCLFYRHVYAIDDSLGFEMPSMTAEKRFPDLPLYLHAYGLKVGSAELSAGGSGVVGVNLSLTGVDEEKSSAAFDAHDNDIPVQFPLVRFSQGDARVVDDGETITNRFSSVTLSINADLDTGDDQYTIGSGGRRVALPEGIMQLSGNISGLFTSTRFLDRAESQARTPLAFGWYKGGYGLTVSMEETEIERKTPGISGPKGIKEEFGYRAFYDTGAAGSAIVVTLQNEIKTWEE